MRINELLKEIKKAALATVALLIIVSGVYPLVVWGLGQVAFSGQANGSLVTAKGQVVGSSLLAQNFSGPQYFHPRPSAAGDTGYDGLSSGGSNLGPLSQKLVDQVRDRAIKYRAENDLPVGTPVPGDAVTASASGLDPHISPENATLQAGRVARARNLSEAQVQRLLAEFTEEPDWGLFGDPRVNVLRLNLALEAEALK